MGDATQAPVPPPSTEDRLQKLEADFQKLRKPKDFWDRLQVFSSFVSGVAILAAGYLVNSGLQERQLQSANAKEMRDLLAKLSEKKDNQVITLEEAEHIDLSLALFGRYAVPALLHEIESGEAVRALAAERGLRAVAFSDPDGVCGPLTRVLQNRSQAFAWYTHLSAIHVLADADCRQSLPELQRYQITVAAARQNKAAVQQYQKLVRDDAPPTLENLERLSQELERTIRLLKEQ